MADWNADAAPRERLKRPGDARGPLLVGIDLEARAIFMQGLPQDNLFT